MDKISIITTSYNYENFITETIESVISQTFQNWEMVIVDDGSTDNSVEIIKDFCQKDSRIKFFQHENGKNKGLAETLKLGISKSTSDWIVFLESDDTITTDYLEKKLKIAEKYPNVSFIFNDTNMFGNEDVIEIYKHYFNKQKKILNKYKYPANMLKAFQSTHKNLIPTFSCVMAKKNLFNNIDFNSPIKQALDYHLWIQLVKNNDFYYIDEKLTNWRMHKNSYINSQNINYTELFRHNLKRIYYLHGIFAFFKYILFFINSLNISFMQDNICKTNRING